METPHAGPDYIVIPNQPKTEHRLMEDEVALESLHTSFALLRERDEAARVKSFEAVSAVLDTPKTPEKLRLLGVWLARHEAILAVGDDPDKKVEQGYLRELVNWMRTDFNENARARFVLEGYDKQHKAQTDSVTAQKPLNR